MKKFPKFLRQRPTFLGLELLDLVVLLLLVNAGQAIGLAPTFVIGLSLGMIFSYKLVLKNFDLVGFFLSSKTKSLSWIDEVKERGL
ncbi:MAG: hypothetical protein CMJ16_03480 [Peredibacter sp.]|nr:hypothetical protein [Peredibacter sp.]